LGTQSNALRQLQPQHRQADGDTSARAQHHMQVAVVGIVVIIEVAAKAKFVKEKLIEKAQLL
jgi:hypothetical protein